MRRGRKTKLTPERQERICALIRAGHYKKVAAIQAGIDESKFYEWMRQGVPGHKKYRRVYEEFREAVQKAEADSEIILLNEVLKGGPRMALEVLSRRFNQRWGSREERTIKGDSDNPVAIKADESLVKIVIKSPDDLWNDSDGDE